jgi:hypothetical protein
MKLELRPITIKAANKVIKEWHRHNKPVHGALWATSAYVDGILVAVAIIGRPVSRNLDDGFTVEVVRCCTTPEALKGTNSFLYGKAKRQAQSKGYRKIITYTLQSESGASMRGAGWNGQPIKGNKNKGWNTREGRDRQEVVKEDKIRWVSEIPIPES